MNGVLDLLVCPLCASKLHQNSVAHLHCVKGHEYPIIEGVPRLTASSEGEVIRETFSHEWSRFDYDVDRTWGHATEDRVQTVLRQLGIDASTLKGKWLLDAGCGNATLSNALTALGCEVVATDISDSVFAARRRFQGNESLHLVQANLMEPPFAAEAFDVIYSGGVLHHTPDTRQALRQVVKTLAPGGRIFIWLYWRVPGRMETVRKGLRRAIAPLPLWAKRGLVAPITAVSVLRHPSSELTWRERRVIDLDYFTPMYRWEHTPDEVIAWFEELGLEDIECTDRVKDGFGVVGVRPMRS